MASTVKAAPTVTDTFGTKLMVGDTVLFSTTYSGGMRYYTGVISKMHPALALDKVTGYGAPARVVVNVTCSSDASHLLATKPSTLNATNVVKYKPEKPCRPKS